MLPQPRLAILFDVATHDTMQPCRCWQKDNANSATVRATGYPNSPDVAVSLHG